MSSRRNGRIVAFQAIFGLEFNSVSEKELLDMEWIDDEYKKKFDDKTLDFSRLLVKGTLENLHDIDTAIKENLVNWDFNRLSKVELAILRISVYSLLYQKSIPAGVTINEAVDIAKEFGTDRSYKFINGVLDGIKKKIAQNV